MHTRQSFVPLLCKSHKGYAFQEEKNQKCVSQSTWNKFNSFEHISCSLLSPVAFCWETVHSVCRNHKPEIKKEDVFAMRSHSNEIFIHWFLMCGFVRRKARFVCIYILRAMWWHSHPEVFFFPKQFASCSNSVRSNNQSHDVCRMQVTLLAPKFPMSFSLEHKGIC